MILKFFLLFITNITDNSILWILLTIFLLLRRRNKKVILMLICGLFLSYFFIINFYKHFILKPRPFIYFPNFKLYIKQPNSLSFPSGHTLTASFLTEIPMYFKSKKKFYFFVLLLIIIMFSRIYFNMHFILDIFFSNILSYFIILNINFFEDIFRCLH